MSNTRQVGGFMRNGIILFIILSVFYINTYAQNSFNKSIRLNGEKQYIEIPDAEYLNPDTYVSLSIELIFKPDGEHPANLIHKWEYPHESNYGKGFSFGINLSSVTVEGRIRKDYFNRLEAFPFPGNARVASGYASSTSSSATEYYFHEDDYNHVIFSISHNSYAPSFLNGDSVIFGYKGANENKIPGHPLCIGGTTYGLDSTLDHSYYFKGEIDEIRIWNRLRTKEEVLSTMYKPLGPEYYTTADSGLVAYYKLDELQNLGVGDDGEANDIFDYSVNAHHAQVIGGAVLVDNDWTTSIESNPFEELDTEYRLEQNYPNPFNPTTKIDFYLPESGHVVFKIYDMLGREVQTLFEKDMKNGQHSVNWNPKTLASGFYIGQLISNNYRKSIKMILQK
jgi:hypothetical protein